MGIIRLDKQYEKLYVVGCSFTTGFIEGEKASWGVHLAKKLNCECIIGAINSNSNFNLMIGLIELCETTDMSKNCVGIQLTERNRREIWNIDKSTYQTFNYATLDTNDYESLNSELKFFKKNIDFVSPIFFDDRENMIRNITSIIMLKNYLENKKIDYIIFEGISSLLDDLNDIGDVIYSKLLDTNFRKKLLDDPTFFCKYGPMQPFCRTHPLFDWNKNDTHPNSEFVEWWVNEMYDHIKNNQ